MQGSNGLIITFLKTKNRARPALLSTFEPQQPVRSVYLGYSPDTFGLLLLPRPKKRGQSKQIDIGSIWGGLRIVDDKVSGSVIVANDPDGYPVYFYCRLH